MEAVATKNILKDLEEIVGEKRVRADDVVRWTYAIEDFAGSSFIRYRKNMGRLI